MVVPSWAVTTIEIVLAPTPKGMVGELTPLAIAVPFTVIVARLSEAVGVTVKPVIPLATLTV